VVILNHYNPTTRIARQAKDALESHYPEFLSRTVVRQCTTFAQASSVGVPVNAYAPKSRGAKDVDALVDEIINTPLEQAEEKRA